MILPSWVGHSDFQLLNKFLTNPKHLGSMKISIDKGRKLLWLGEFFGINELKLFSIQRIIPELHSKNVFEFLIESHKRTINKQIEAKEVDLWKELFRAAYRISTESLGQIPLKSGEDYLSPTALDYPEYPLLIQEITEKYLTKGFLGGNIEYKRAIEHLIQAKSALTPQSPLTLTHLFQTQRSERVKDIKSRISSGIGYINWTLSALPTHDNPIYSQEYMIDGLKWVFVLSKNKELTYSLGAKMLPDIKEEDGRLIDKYSQGMRTTSHIKTTLPTPRQDFDMNEDIPISSSRRFKNPRQGPIKQPHNYGERDIKFIKKENINIPKKFHEPSSYSGQYHKKQGNYSVDEFRKIKTLRSEGEVSQTAAMNAIDKHLFGTKTCTEKNNTILSLISHVKLYPSDKNKAIIIAPIFIGNHTHFQICQISENLLKSKTVKKYDKSINKEQGNLTFSINLRLNLIISGLLNLIKDQFLTKTLNPAKELINSLDYSEIELILNYARVKRMNKYYVVENFCNWINFHYKQENGLQYTALFQLLEFDSLNVEDIGKINQKISNIQNISLRKLFQDYIHKRHIPANLSNLYIYIYIDKEMKSYEPHTGRSLHEKYNSKQRKIKLEEYIIKEKDEITANCKENNILRVRMDSKPVKLQETSGINIDNIESKNKIKESEGKVSIYELGRDKIISKPTQEIHIEERFTHQIKQLESHTHSVERIKQITQKKELAGVITSNDMNNIARYKSKSKSEDEFRDLLDSKRLISRFIQPKTQPENYIEYNPIQKEEENKGELITKIISEKDSEISRLKEELQNVKIKSKIAHYIVESDNMPTKKIFSDRGSRKRSDEHYLNTYTAETNRSMNESYAPRNLNNAFSTTDRCTSIDHDLDDFSQFEKIIKEAPIYMQTFAGTMETYDLNHKVHEHNLCPNKLNLKQKDVEKKEIKVLQNKPDPKSIQNMKNYDIKSKENVNLAKKKRIEKNETPKFKPIHHKRSSHSVGINNLSPPISSDSNKQSENIVKYHEFGPISPIRSENKISSDINSFLETPPVQKANNPAYSPRNLHFGLNLSNKKGESDQINKLCFQSQNILADLRSNLVIPEPPPTKIDIKKELSSPSYIFGDSLMNPFNIIDPAKKRVVKNTNSFIAEGNLGLMTSAKEIIAESYVNLGSEKGANLNEGKLYKKIHQEYGDLVREAKIIGNNRDMITQADDDGRNNKPRAFVKLH